MNTNITKSVIFREVNNKSKPFIDIDLVSKIIGVPKDVLVYHIDDTEDLVSLQDYVNYGRATAKHIGLRAILYLTQIFKKDISLWTTIIEAMYDNNNNYEEKYTNLCVALKNLCMELDKDTDPIIDDTDDLLNAELNNTTTKKKTYLKNSKLLPALTEEETIWQQNALDLVKEKAKKASKPPASFLRIIYGIMTHTYNIAFDKEKTDIRNMFNLDEDEHISNLYVVTVSVEFRSIFDSVLAEM